MGSLMISMIVKDMLQHYYRLPKEVRQEMTDMWGLYPEGLDGQLEESNRRTKRASIAETPQGITFGALISNVIDNLRSCQLKLKGGSPPVASGAKSRTPTQLNPDIILMPIRHQSKHVYP